MSINRYIYASDNPLRYNDPSGFISNIIITSASKVGPGIGCGGGSVNDLVYGFNNTELAIDPNNLLETFRTINNRIDVMIDWAIAQANFPAGFWERNYDNANVVFKL